MDRVIPFRLGELDVGDDGASIDLDGRGLALAPVGKARGSRTQNVVCALICEL